ncbi:MAG: acyltransferase [Plantibacter flavus]
MTTAVRSSWSTMPSPENHATGNPRRDRRPAPRVDHTAFAGARAVAAWWVVFSHSADWLFSVLPELSWLAPMAHTGLAVDVFFVLSGYAIARAYLHRRWTWPTYGRYLRNRFARIYPAHVTVLLAFVLLCVGGAMVGVPTDDGAFPPIGLLAELTLTRAWFGDALWWNPPAWSLSAQFLAFVLFPVFALALRDRMRGPVPVIALSVGLVSTTTIAAAIAPSAMNGMATPAVRVLCCFALGICLAEWTAALPVTRRAAWVAAGGASGLVVAAIALEPGAPRAWAAITFAAIIVGGLAVASPRSTAVLRSRPARILGQLSFSTYLVHVFVLILLAKAIPPSAVDGMPFLLRAPISLVWFGSILAASWLLHTLVEVPWHRRLAAPRTSRAVHADGSATGA